MRTRNKLRRPPTLHFNAGSRCSLSFVVRELEQVEEDNKPKNFLTRTAINPRKEMEDSQYFYPGRIWLDTDGNPILAHGGGILYVESSGAYYWYGKHKGGPTYNAHENGDAWIHIIGVSCYSSKDLWTWKNEGIVLAGEETNETHDLYKSNVLERPKVIYNEKTGKYVMWMHVDDANYTKASVVVAVSSSPIGPSEYLFSKQPHGYDSRDMTIFKDDDDVAYLIYSSEDNSELHIGIGRLSDDYLNITHMMRKILVGKHREAPAIFKHQGAYYMITLGCTGWAPNSALSYAAESILGPWETLENPCVGGNEWNSAELSDSRYVWLPLAVGGGADHPLENNFGFPLWSRVSNYWHKRWRLPDGWKGM
uniref:Uncharacterized protein n=1 Tax=Nelumbo nucifera TaxID=4432 RepID=A0A822XV33_NELNU|nr:TPA_asm: hypothetical protein HUJ06_022771 [Nelumbo nucifera]